MIKIPIIQVLPYYSLAEYWFKDFVKSNEKFIEKVNKGKLTIYLKSRDIIIFMSESDYPKWRKGMVYKLDGKVYRSGYEVVNVRGTGNEVLFRRHCGC